MRISRSRSWHWKVFERWHERKHGYPYEKRTISLCPYMRAVLLWSWMRWVLTDQHRAEAFWGTVVLAAPLAADQPLRVYEGVAWASFAALVIVGAWIFDDWWEARKKRRREEGRPEEPKPPSPFRTLAKAYARSFHDRICPLVEITD